MPLTSTPAERRLQRIGGHLRRLIGEGSAALFRDALRLASDGFGLESQAGLVWHNAREIESAIFQALNPVAPFDEKANEDRMRAAQVEAIIAGLELDEQHAAIGWWKKTSLHTLAHRANLAPPRPFTPGDWQTFLTALELILDAFDARYQRMIERLDTLLAMTPARAGKETKRLLCAVPPTGQATALRHFFERADATWLNTLPRCILDDPPGREFVIDQPGSYRWPGWPASQYLAKVAPERPKQVHGRVMKVLALRPENPFIHMDFITAAAHFPPALMRSWARAETDWLASQATIDSPLLSDVAEATEMLVAAGLTQEAFALGESALSLSDEPPRRYGQPSLRTWDFAYDRAIKAIAPLLIGIDGPRAATFFAALLDQAVKQTHAEARTRWSQVWRASIADDGSNDHPDSLDVMIDTLRNALEAVAVDRQALAEMIALLSRYVAESSLFSRLRIHLVGTKRDLDPDLARATLLDPLTYTSDHWVEAHRLVEAVAPDQDGAGLDQATVAIRSGTLHPEHQNELCDLIETARRGLVPAPITGPHAFTVQRIEPSPSPVSPERMAGWSVPRTVRYLTLWEAEPDHPWRGSDMLAAAFQETVKANISRWSGAGIKVATLPPTFVSRYLYGLREAAKEGATVNWGALVRLLEAGLVTNGLWLGREHVEERKAAAWAMLTGLEGDQFRLPTSFRRALWNVIGAMLSDPSPTAEEEARSLAGNDDDLAHVRLDYARPVAVVVAVAYALWLAQQRTTTPRRLPSEARTLLEARLSDGETSAAVRSAIGERLAVLWWLDAQWVRDVLPLIFPAEQERASLRDAAWSGYLWHPTVHFDVFHALAEEYDRAVNALDADRPATWPEERLAEHLLLLARTGTISAESEDGLLARFFHLAPPDLAREALRDVGWSIWRGREDPADDDEAARLRLLWEWVSAEVAADRVSPVVLGSFGWWFASGRFDLEWSLGHLERIAIADVDIDTLHIVFERLSVLVADHPLEVGLVTEAIVSHETSDEQLHGDDLRAIGRALLDDAAGAEANAIGLALATRMHTRSFPRFPQR